MKAKTPVVSKAGDSIAKCPGATRAAQKVPGHKTGRASSAAVRVRATVVKGRVAATVRGTVPAPAGKNSGSSRSNGAGSSKQAGDARWAKPTSSLMQ